MVIFVLLCIGWCHGGGVTEARTGGAALSSNMSTLGANLQSHLSTSVAICLIGGH